MSGTFSATMGDRGRLVIPAELRERAGLAEGTALLLIETDGGLVVMTREQLKRRVRNDLDGSDLVTELLADRQAASAAEDLAAG
jgi:AbrB family looped-hinge helix DNA binding protein